MRCILLSRTLFLIEGNMCGDRIRIARAMQKPAMAQKELALKINLMGYDNFTPLMISRIEKNQRHVCDAELYVISKALGVSMEWLCGEGSDLDSRLKY